MAPPTLTPADLELLVSVFKTGSIDVDTKRIAEDLSIKPGAASMRWTRFKEKILKSAAGEASAGDANDGDSNAPKTPASSKKRRAHADTPATGTGKQKGRGKAAKTDDSDDQDGAEAGAAMDEVDASPSKKVKVEGDEE